MSSSHRFSHRVHTLPGGHCGARSLPWLDNAEQLRAFIADLAHLGLGILRTQRDQLAQTSPGPQLSPADRPAGMPVEATGLIV